MPCARCLATQVTPVVQLGLPVAVQSVDEAAAPGHVDAVRRLFIDRLTADQLDAIGDAAQLVLAALDEPAAPRR